MAENKDFSLCLVSDTKPSPAKPLAQREAAAKSAADNKELQKRADDAVKYVRAKVEQDKLYYDMSRSEMGRVVQNTMKKVLAILTFKAVSDSEAPPLTKEQRELEIAVQQDYANVLAYMKTQCIKKKRVLGDHDDNEQQDESTAESPAKKLKLSCPTKSMLSHAQRMHQKRLTEIQQQVSHEKSIERSKLLTELEQRMQAKQESLQQEAKEECEKIKTVIQGLASK